MMKKTTKIGGIIVLGVSLWYLNTIDKKYNNIYTTGERLKK